MKPGARTGTDRISPPKRVGLATPVFRTVARAGRSGSRWKGLVAGRYWIILLSGLLAAPVSSLKAMDETAMRFFDQGLAAAKDGDTEQAFHMFGDAALIQPASGTLHNFANAAWAMGREGPAVLAWEQALWLDPRNVNAQTSLRYARHTGNLEEPDLRWFEVCSSWLPAAWWPWISAGSF